MRRLEGPLGGRGGGKGKPCRQFAQMRVGSRRRKGRGMQTDAWDGARKGCGRARPQAGTRGRTWAATRRRGHRETAATMTALKRCSFTPFFWESLQSMVATSSPTDMCSFLLNLAQHAVLSIHFHGRCGVSESCVHQRSPRPQRRPRAANRRANGGGERDHDTGRASSEFGMQRGP